MFHYRCPDCGNISTEGFAIYGGPECVRCGAEMVASNDEDRRHEDDAGRKRRPPSRHDVRTV